MKDLIDRREAINALDRAAECWNIAEPFNEGMRAGYKAAVTIVLSLPSAQPERMRGKWIERNPQNSDKCRLIECDQCGFSHIVGFNVPYEHWIENRNFCERCGADMRRSSVVKCESCRYSSVFTDGIILCEFLKKKICVTANHSCKYGKQEEQE